MTPSPFRPDLFADRKALVTGGTSGIGLGIATALARHGATVLVTGRDEERLQKTKAVLEDAGAPEVGTFAFDVREADAVKAAAKEVDERFGALDVLVNNAAGNFVAPFAMMSDNAWKAVVDIVLQGTFNTTRAFGRGMIDAGKKEAKAGGAEDRAVVNIVAGYAWTGAPGVAHSGAAKAAVLNLTKTLGVEWAGVGVRVNAISPGPIEQTGGAEKLWEEAGEEVAEMVRESVPLKRYGTPEDIGNAALFLLSPASRYVTGTCVVVDGGQDARGPLGFDRLIPRFV